ncbi:MAG: hypothetical protein CSB44_01690 [Gammaproteobacteria bacterium]|nr:MAG: hypothetical protein CSB44_01690 [Gammaproteobacteria bacterium]
MDIPASNDPSAWVGIGFKQRYLADLLPKPGEGVGSGRPCSSIGWLEIHAENYMVAGGPKKAMLEALAEHYPISCHGVGLSIGGSEPLDDAHLGRLRTLERWLEPALFSEHLAWSSHGRNNYPDLLPLPYNETTLSQVVAHVGQMQDVLGRQILLENPSSYLEFEATTMSETEFLAAVVRESGCGLLLDVNNVYVSANNIGFDAGDYLASFPVDAVGEIHVAGHRRNADPDAADLLIDSHDAPVADPVWMLYASVIARVGPAPTLIERDGALPAFGELVAEADIARRLLEPRSAA